MKKALGGAKVVTNSILVYSGSTAWCTMDREIGGSGGTSKHMRFLD
jgi:hypothetical protein